MVISYSTFCNCLCLYPFPFLPLRPHCFDGLLNPEGRPIIVFEPDQWVGEKLPLVNYLDPLVRSQLDHGKQTIVIIDHNCDHCLDYLKSLAMRDRNAAPSDSVTVVDLAAAPLLNPLYNRFFPVRLRGSRILHGQTPSALSLREGIVVEVYYP